MRVYQTHELDRTLDFQLVDCGGGLLETYALGLKTGSFVIGEIAIRNIAKKIEYLTDDRAQQLGLEAAARTPRKPERRISRATRHQEYPKLKLF